MKVIGFHTFLSSCLEVGGENIRANSIRKANKYTPLLQDLSSSYNKVIFINVSMGALGVMGSSCDSFLSLLQDLSFDKVTQ